MKKILSIFMVIGLMLVGCTSEDTPKEEVKSEYQIGETADYDGLLITLNGVRVMEGDEIFKPEAGQRWIALDFTFENTKSEKEYVAGIFSITLRDTEGREKEQNIWGDIQGSLDGDVLANDKLSGEKSFIINEDETDFIALYSPMGSSKDPIKFVVKVGE